MNENELDVVLCRMVDWDSERARDSSRYRAQSPDKDHSKPVRRQLSKSPVLVSSIVTRTVATRDERSSLSMSGFGLAMPCCEAEVTPVHLRERFALAGTCSRRPRSCHDYMGQSRSLRIAGSRSF